MTVPASYGEREYSGVVLKVANSPIYRLVAPDDTTVETWSEQPSLRDAQAALEANGYESKHHVPFRDMDIGDENLPGDLTVP